MNLLAVFEDNYSISSHLFRIVVSIDMLIKGTPHVCIKQNEGIQELFVQIWFCNKRVPTLDHTYIINELVSVL